MDVRVRGGRDGYPYSNSDRYANSHTYSDTDSDTNADPNRDAYRHADIHPYRDVYRPDPHVNAYTDTYAHRDSSEWLLYRRE